MAKLENYTGNTELGAGLCAKNNGDFALMEASSIQTREDGTRLDEELRLMQEAIENSGDDNSTIDLPLEKGDGENSIQQTLDAESWSSINERMLEHLESVNYTTEDGAVVQKDASGNFLVGAFGKNSTMMNGKSQTVGGKTHAEGSKTLAFENNAHAEGNATYAGGKHAHAEGNETAATANSAHAEGNGTIASGISTHAEGEGTIAEGQASHAEGHGTNAIGKYAHSEGAGSRAEGLSSHAEGSTNIAFMENAHAEGNSTVAGNVNTHTEGHRTFAFGEQSHAEGNRTFAGIRGFNIVKNISAMYWSIVNDDRITIELDSVEGLEVGDCVSVILYERFLDIGKIIQITNNSVILDVMSINGELNKELVRDSNGSIISGSIYNTLFVRFKPNLGTKMLGHHTHAEGAESIAIGNRSHSEGYQTKALGDDSHAEGNGTAATANGSHAEGTDTEANGLHSHAEGRITKASGTASHAEGMDSYATGNYSHAEGDTTSAAGECSHSEGCDTTALGHTSHAEGFKNIAYSHDSHVEGSECTAGMLSYYWSSIDFDNKTIVVSKEQGIDPENSFNINYEVGDVVSIVNDSKYPNCSTITAINGNIITVDTLPFTKIDYDESSELSEDDYTLYVASKHTVGEITLGYYAHAEGLNTKAIERAAHSEGRQTEAIGQYSHAEGRQSKSIGYCSHAEGRLTSATAENSHAEGYSTTASGTASHAEGNTTEASGLNSHAEGRETKAEGYCSHVEGRQTEAEGDCSHAEGYNTYARGTNSHAEGIGTHAGGINSHAEGRNTYALGEYSHSEGSVTYASGNHSHAEGSYVVAHGECSHAEGYSPESYYYSHSLKDLNVDDLLIDYDKKAFSMAFGSYSHVEGQQNLAIGSASHAEGIQNIAKGDGSHAEGRRTIASGTYQHVQGKYNQYEDENGNPLNLAHIVGGGSSAKNRKNIHTIDWDGNAWFAGKITGGNKEIATTSNKEIGRLVNGTFGESISQYGVEIVVRNTAADLFDSANEVVFTIDSVEYKVSKDKLVRTCSLDTSNAGISEKDVGTMYTYNLLADYPDLTLTSENDYSYATVYAIISTSKTISGYDIDTEGNAWFAGSVDATKIYVPEIYLTSPNGSVFRLTVNDDGTINIASN